jgi:uncharacterized protein YndB with AHSA1/START domain
MKWITIVLVIVAAIALAGAVATFIGSRLPRGHHATAERLLPLPPEVLWRTLTDVERFPSWRRDVTHVRRLPDREGKPAWVEEGRSGKMTFAFERMEPPRLLVSRIADPNLPFGGTWTMEITPVSGGARLQITEDGEIYNPLFRFMARFVFGYDGTINGYFSALERTVHGV